MLGTRQGAQVSQTQKVDTIGALQGRLRATHLQAHLEQAAILTPAQNALYSQLRGYGQGASHHQH